MPVKRKESGTIPNSFSYRLGYNLSYFWGALHCCYDSSFHCSNLFQRNLISCLSLLYINQICIDLSSGNVFVGEYL